MAIKPVGNYIFIKLPQWQSERVRKTPSGIFIPHLEEKTEHDSSTGEVVAIGDRCTICEVGDTVFFDYYSVNNALQNAGRDKTRHDHTKNSKAALPVYYIENSYSDDVPELPKGLYIVMPETRVTQNFEAKNHHEERVMGGNSLEIPVNLGVLCLIRNGELMCCNGYYLIARAYDEGELIDGVRVKQQGLIQSVILKDEEQKNKQYKILCAPQDGEYEVGDIIRCMPNVEIKVEGTFNYPQFPANTFYVESSLIIAKIEQEEPVAA